MPSFRELFVGSEYAHGEWHSNIGDKGQGKTLPSPASDVDYQNHLTGKLGLGLVPIRADGTVRFASIDIDVDTIDHKALAAKVTALGLQLNVFRSKSGGAHCTIFYPEPGVKATEARVTLKKYAALLGYPKAEIFPKQNSVTQKDFGNWINLPYFGGDSTTRYCVGVGGEALTLAEFEQQAVIYDPNKKCAESSPDEQEPIQLAVLTPCMAAIIRDGIPKGVRNNGLFNLAVNLRKAYPKDWEERLRRVNARYCTPPLSAVEVENVIKSLNKTKYQYTCEQEPCASRCDRPACLQSPFGVGNMPWDEEGAFEPLIINNLRKVMTDPPTYLMEVNGHDLEFTWPDLRNFRRFQDAVVQKLNKVIAPIKEGKWMMMLNDQLKTVEEIPAPEDASIKGTILAKAQDYFGLHAWAREKDQILLGQPYLDAESDEVWFRAADLQRYLKGQKVETIEMHELYMVLRQLGCKHRDVVLKGKKQTLWSVPKTKINVQTVDFDKPQFQQLNQEL